MEKHKLSKMIDQTVLKADATMEEINKLCKDAKKYDFACVMINPCMINYCKEALIGSNIHIGTVIGFPLGQNMLQTKIEEAKLALINGAKEIDYVLNISELQKGNLEYIKEEMHQITEISHKNDAICKVILETCYLTKEQIESVCKIAVEEGIDFVKTSTGFGTKGATIEDVLLMKKVVGDKVKIKASGGIRTYDFAIQLIEAGAQRIGTSNGITIVNGLDGVNDY